MTNLAFKGRFVLWQMDHDVTLEHFFLRKSFVAGLADEGLGNEIGGFRASELNFVMILFFYLVQNLGLRPSILFYSKRIFTFKI